MMVAMVRVLGVRCVLALCFLPSISGFYAPVLTLGCGRVVRASASWASPAAPRSPCRSLASSRGPEDELDLGKVVAGPILAVLIGATALTGSGALFGAPSNQQTVRVTREDGSVEVRGALTKLTRSEIQKKLSQVPCFYARLPEGGVALDSRGEGVFYLDFRDAEKEISSSGYTAGTSVAATTLDDVYYSLLEKKGKPLPGVGGGAAGFSDASASYRLVPSKSSLSSADRIQPGWASSTGTADRAKGPVPLFSAERLAFQALGRPKVPLFLSVQDVEDSWRRLDTGNPPVIKVTSLQAILSQMERGGGEYRNLEFYPDVENIDNAMSMGRTQQ